ncbi:uncharacterized protein LY79DRAFT_659612 [Colletotrichum navitas]|uniref:Uncharacterized protein n=1 Tax=Colletotrichum navitas TaxID=681940 RepID=A0AAD8V2Z7_9PEZI|nr:uncharacterized protein LY79DRAFT_659612 [Colletotrichum navitas]KAK1590340.1 hypothetical protein LY79DRAFT_659612 [Colletotrichum navitas]
MAARNCVAENIANEGIGPTRRLVVNTLPGHGSQQPVYINPGLEISDSMRLAARRMLAEATLIIGSTLPIIKRTLQVDLPTASERGQRLLSAFQSTRMLSLASGPPLTPLTVKVAPLNCPRRGSTNRNQVGLKAQRKILLELNIKSRQVFLASN